jgi:hypothetical protein
MPMARTRSPDRPNGKERKMSRITEVRAPKIAGAAKLSVGRWFKRVGDPVGVGEPIVEIETLT